MYEEFYLEQKTYFQYIRDLWYKFELGFLYVFEKNSQYRRL